MCDFAVDITHGARKAVGGGSSAVGITASVVKEEESLGGYRVEPGAMVLAKELLFIDELNNLPDEDKPRLQEGMSEQVVSINKANLHVQMKVTAGVIAAANPIGGSFSLNEEHKIEDQFNIPTLILNRFDTVFVIKDSINEESDKKIAEKMIRRHRKIISHAYDKDLLRKFFVYIRHLDNPQIDDRMEEYLKEVYHLSRKRNKSTVKINPRFLEALTRMVIASAKIRQSPIVELKDIQTCIKILAESEYKVNEEVIDLLDKEKLE
jgi:DNA replicative helicase MCM subunit Mcm2 (Cdc46/Mcm family)